MAGASDVPSNRQDFLKWFWQGSNGNELIKELNDCGFSGDNYIRREKIRPTIYAIVLNDGKFPFETQDEHGKRKWKLCKVGFTQVSTEQGSGNRMEDLEAQISYKYSRSKSRLAQASTLFVLPIGAVDSTPHLQTEKRIREAVGNPVPTGVAKKHCLPCPTEWVLTTQKFIDKIKEKATECKSVDLFKHLVKPPQPPEDWLEKVWKQ